MDLVYIVKEDDHNDDLRYSLRSVAKYVKYDKIWIVGYKPSWVQNVEYLPVKQTGNKWTNSVKNILTACQCDKISEDFVLMNDDFFAIKSIDDLDKSINVSLGLLKNSIRKHSKLKSRWGNAFRYLYELLKSLRIPEPYYDFESHIPLKINRKKYLEIMNYQKVQEFMKTPKVLHKRSLYKNCSASTNPTIIKDDVKIENDREVLKKIDICDWLSVYDNQVNNPKFKRLNYLLQTLFPTKCQYEKDNFVPIKVNKEEIEQVDNRPRRIVVINQDGTRKIIIQPNQ